MTTWATRITSAQEREQEVWALLEQGYGCQVSFFGQSQLPEKMRDRLRAYPSKPNIRWLPDLLVERDYLRFQRVQEYIWLVDVKSCRLDTDYWDIEQASLAAHRSMRYQLGLPIVYVWPDGCSYVEDLRDNLLINGPYRGNGSGTPFWLFPKKYARPLEEVFGVKVETLEDEPF
jgi:ribulose bisphosphate carboxylase small subunit